MARPGVRAAILVPVVVLGAMLVLGAGFTAAPNSGRTWRLAETTVRLIAAVELISLPLGFGLAVGIHGLSRAARNLTWALLLAMICVPLYVHVAAWQAGFGLQGWQATHWRQAPWLVGLRGAAWVHGVHGAYWVALVISVAIDRLDPILGELAALDLSPAQVWRRVTLRQLAPALVGVAAWLAVLVAGEIAVTDMFQVRTYAEELYTELALGGEPGAAPLTAWPGVLATAVALLVAVQVVRAWTITPRTRGERGAVNAIAPGTRRLGQFVTLAALMLLIGAPLAQLAAQAGLDLRVVDGARTRQWSASKLVAIVSQSPGRFQRELRWSTQIGLLAATATLLVAVPLAWRGRTSRGARRVSTALVLLSLAVPGPVVGLLLIRAFDRPGVPLLTYLYDHSLAVPVLAIVWRTLGVALLLVTTGLAELSRAWIEAAANSGLSPWATWRRVILPTAWPGLALAWLACFALAIGELSATILVLPPRVTTLAVRISNLTHYGVDDQLAALCLLVTLLATVIALVALALVRRT